MDNPINIHIQDNEMPSNFEELEVRRALNKKHLPNPDVNAEWEQFMHTLQQENPTIWQRIAINSNYSQLSSLESQPP